MIPFIELLRMQEKIASKTTTQNSFEAIANEWLAQQTDKADVTRAKAKWLLQFAIAEFGQVPIHEVTPPWYSLLAAKKKVQAS